MPFGDVVGPEKLKDFFLKHVNPEAVACVVAEPVQGEGGFIARPPGYFQTLATICRENGILFVADEIQSGMGRTAPCSRSSTGGSNRPHHGGQEPGAGMPIASVVGRKEIMDSVHPGAWAAPTAATRWPRGGSWRSWRCSRRRTCSQGQGPGQKLNERLEAFRKKYKIVGEIPRLGAMLGLTLVKGSQREPAADEARSSPLSAWSEGSSSWCADLQQRGPRARTLRDHGRAAGEGAVDPGAGLAEMSK